MYIIEIALIGFANVHCRRFGCPGCRFVVDRQQLGSRHANLVQESSLLITVVQTWRGKKKRKLVVVAQRCHCEGACVDVVDVDG